MSSLQSEEVIKLKTKMQTTIYDMWIHLNDNSCHKKKKKIIISLILNNISLSTAKLTNWKCYNNNGLYKSTTQSFQYKLLLIVHK